MSLPLPLTLTNVLEAEVNLPALLQQCGIPSQDEAKCELTQSFGPKVWLIQNVFGLVFLALVALVLWGLYGRRDTTTRALVAPWTVRNKARTVKAWGASDVLITGSGTTLTVTVVRI